MNRIFSFRIGGKVIIIAIQDVKDIETGYLDIHDEKMPDEKQTGEL